MAQLLVRGVEDDVKARLRRRAQRHGRSMEEEVRHILRNAVKEEARDRRGLGSRIAARFAQIGLTGDLPEVRGGAPQPATFDR
jgi:plasmid stability protein